MHKYNGPHCAISLQRFDERTVYFGDGTRKIGKQYLTQLCRFFFNSVAQCCTDFILCYEKCHPATDDVIEQEGQNLDQISSFSNSKKAQARKKFLNAIQADGNYKLECEIQHWKVRRFPQTKK